MSQGQFNSTNKDNCRCVNHYYQQKPKLKLQSQTTTKAFYKPLPLQKPTPFEVPKVQQKHYDPEVLQTSYKSQYIKPNLQSSHSSYNSQLQKTNSNLISSYMKSKPNVPFYSDTSYKDSYKPLPITVQKQPAYEYKPKNTKFEGQSRYKADFVPKKSSSDLVNAGQSIVSVKDYINRKPKVPFEGSSYYKDTFKAYEIKQQKQPEYKYTKNPNKFQGSSSYKQTFKAPPKQAFKSDIQHCPVHPGKIAIK